MYLLDTDTLGHLHADHPGVVQRLREKETSEVGTTIITKIEVLRGRIEFMLKAANGDELLRAQKLLLHSEEQLAEIIVLPFNQAASRHFDRLRQTKGLKKIDRPDLLIASITLAYRAILVTRNLRHFRAIPNLQVENWVD